MLRINLLVTKSVVCAPNTHAATDAIKLFNCSTSLLKSFSIFVLFRESIKLAKILLLFSLKLCLHCFINPLSATEDRVSFASQSVPVCLPADPIERNITLTTSFTRPSPKFPIALFPLVPSLRHDIASLLKWKVLPLGRLENE